MNDNLRSPIALKKLGELRGTGMSWTAIQQTIERELEIKASLPTIQNAYKVYCARSSEIVAGDDELKNTLKEAVLNTADQLKEINNIMMGILKEARTASGDKIAASKEILNQLYFQEKLLNRISQGFDWGKISRVEYTKISINNLEELEKAGYIKILKKPGMMNVTPNGMPPKEEETIVDAEYQDNNTLKEEDN